MSRLWMLRWIAMVAVWVVTAPAALAQGYNDPITSARPYRWSGFYIGLQGGYGISTIDAVSGPYGGAYDQAYRYDSRGFFGGAHFGHNWQNGHYLLGVEVDLDASNVSTKSVGTLGYVRDTHVDWQSTVRGRLGWVSGPLLLYATGGLALSQSTTSSSVGGILSPFASVGERYVGWTAGGGLERAITQDTTLRLEYRYIDYGSVNTSSAATNTQSHSAITANQLRAGISFRF